MALTKTTSLALRGMPLPLPIVTNLIGSFFQVRFFAGGGERGRGRGSIRQSRKRKRSRRRKSWRRRRRVSEVMKDSVEEELEVAEAWPRRWGVVHRGIRAVDPAT